MAIDLYLENQNLKSEFERRGLDLSQVWQPTPEDLALENRQLRSLLDWVEKFEECPNRKEMEAQGYLYPPINPGIDPDNDWFLFRRWMQGKPTRVAPIKRLPPALALAAPEKLTDEEIEALLEKLTDELAEFHIAVDLKEGVPPRLVYEHLLETLKEELELLCGGAWHLDGCTGYCPGCFQRPWCEGGGELCWQEDEAAGHMVFAESARRYASPSPVSLELLRRSQAEHDEKMKKIMAEMKDEDVF
jgi:hypothetical protein